MSAVTSRKCEQCGAEARDPRGWVRIYARPAAFQPSDLAGIQRQSANVVVIGGVAGEFAEADLCSPACAGKWLFGVKP